MAQEKEKFVISVVVPIYNTSEYLHQLMRSIIYQTLSMEKIQVILVNDGSTDDSDKICKEYSKQYEQILYINLDKNYGVSHARNLGMRYASGRYITFLDSDDLWSLNAFETAAVFLDRHYYTIDAVNANIEFIERRMGKHYLWFDAPQDYIVDMYTEYQRIGSHCSSFILKTEIAKQYQFDEKQTCWEDTKYINQVLLRKKKFGWLSDVTYYYRVRKNAGSATDFYGKDKGYYFEQLTRFVDDIRDASEEECGEFMPMMQYLTAYALAFRVAEKITILDEQEIKEYYKILHRILRNIEDKYILECCNADKWVKTQMIILKQDLGLLESIQLMKQQNTAMALRNEQAARIRKNYALLRQWFFLRSLGKTVVPYFDRIDCKQIAVYGMSDLGKFLCEELKESSVSVLYAIDKRADKLEADIPVYDLDADLPKADAIVVTAIYFFDQIFKDLQGKVQCPIISLEEILYAIEQECSDG